MISILTAMKLSRIVIDGAIPPLDATEEELETLALMQNDGMLL